MWYAMLACLLFAIGCGEKADEKKVTIEVKGLPGPTNEGPSPIQKQHDQEEKLKADLKADPSPVADLALESIRKAYAAEAGDEAVKAATITVDKSSIKTFGGEKWTVRGRYKGKDKDGNDKDVTWESTAQLMFGKLQIRKQSLQVSQ